MGGKSAGYMPDPRLQQVYDLNRQVANTNASILKQPPATCAGCGASLNAWRCGYCQRDNYNESTK